MVISYGKTLYFKIQCKEFTNKITLHFLIFLYYKEFTQQYEYENHCRSLYFSYLLKISIKIQQKIPVLLKSNQNNKIKFVVSQKHNLSLLQNCVSKNENPLPKLPSLGSPKSPST
jgi:hypothetical protein